MDTDGAEPRAEPWLGERRRRDNPPTLRFGATRAGSLNHPPSPSLWRTGEINEIRERFDRMDRMGNPVRPRSGREGAGVVSELRSSGSVYG